MGTRTWPGRAAWHPNFRLQPQAGHSAVAPSARGEKRPYSMTM